MNILTSHQLIMHQGMPVAVVVPYEEYVATFAVKGKKGKRKIKTKKEEPTIPHDVVVYALKEQVSSVRAWREYLGLTQADVAARMDVSQSAFAQMETSDSKLRMKTLKKIAAALGLVPDQLR